MAAREFPASFGRSPHGPNRAPRDGAASPVPRSETSTRRVTCAPAVAASRCISRTAASGTSRVTASIRSTPGRRHHTAIFADAAYQPVVASGQARASPNSARSNGTRRCTSRANGLLGCGNPMRSGSRSSRAATGARRLPDIGRGSSGRQTMPRTAASARRRSAPARRLGRPHRRPRYKAEKQYTRGPGPPNPRKDGSLDAQN
jgi:hypothetical protein